MLHNGRIKQPLLKPRWAFTFWDLDYRAAFPTSLLRPPEEGLVTFALGDGAEGCPSYGRHYGMGNTEHGLEIIQKQEEGGIEHPPVEVTETE